MKCIGFSIVLLVASFATAQERTSRVSGSVILLASPDAQGRLTTNQLNQCLSQLAEQWRIEADSLPTVIVFHVSKNVAQELSLQGDINIRRNESGQRHNSYYEVWLVGEPTTQTAVLALENVLEVCYHLHVTNKQRIDVVTRVSRFQDATVSALAKQ